MRHKITFPLLFALAGLLSRARARACGACSYLSSCCSTEQCCMPCNRICYQTVVEEKSCVCYRKVYQTEMRECRTTVCKPVYEQCYRDCRYTECKPCWEEYNVVRKYTVCKPVYEQHVREVPYTVCKPHWQEYQVPVQWTTYKPVYESHVREVPYTICRQVWHEYKVPVRTALASRSTNSTSAKCRIPSKAGLAGIPGAGAVDDLPGGLRRSRSGSARTRPASRCGSNTQVPVNYCTYKPVYEQHTARFRSRAAKSSKSREQRVCKYYTCEPVWTEKEIKRLHRRLENEQVYCPGKTITRQCRTPGCWIFDLHVHVALLPGRNGVLHDAAPGPLDLQEDLERGGSHRPLLPLRAEGALPDRELHGLQECALHREPTVNYTTCKMVAEQHTKQVTCQRCKIVQECHVQKVPYTTCKMVPEHHCKIVTQRRCHMVSEQHVRKVPYTTCRLVQEQHVKMVTRGAVAR